MPLEGRDGLITRFQKGYIPTSRDFRFLIDSSVNKRDDQFFGRWQRGMKYCNGDVVLYRKSLYMLDLNQKTEGCPPAEGQEADDKDADCICSTEPPTKGDCWCLLELQMEDKDWKIKLNESTGEPEVVYNLVADIGIGTENPQSPLEIAHANGTIQVQPNQDAAPAIRMIRFQPDSSEHETANIRLFDQLDHHTNSLGYAFYRKTQQAEDIGSQSKQQANKAQSQQSDEPVLLVFATSTATDIPQLGVGTDEPKASLDVVAPERGRMMVHPFPGNTDAASLLLNTQPSGNGHYLLSGVNEDNAYFQTDANKGLKIIQGTDVSDLEKKLGTGETSVTIDAEGNVGIGTEEPLSKLHLTDGKCGTIRADFNQNNVCISTINERPAKQHNETYSAMGVDDDFATFITDTPYGFVFKAGDPYGEGDLDNEVNIDQGEKVVFISPEGKTGIRTMDVPDYYDLDVNGVTRSLNAGILTNNSTIKAVSKSLKDENILEKVCSLEPLRFKYKETTNASNKDEHIGLDADKVWEHIPEATSRSDNEKSSSSRSILYSNLTAVLVQAIKDQQAQIEDLNERLCALEEQAGTGGD